MATYILDTHPLVWYFEKSSQLSKKVRDLLTFGDGKWVIPSIVVCELVFLARKGRFFFDVAAFRKTLDSDDRFSIFPLDETMGFELSPHLEMHDAIIVATASRYRLKDPQTFIVTKDRQIQSVSECPVFWK